MSYHGRQPGRAHPSDANAAGAARQASPGKSTLTIEPPLAGAWLEGRLVLWTGRAGAVVSTWRLVH